MFSFQAAADGVMDYSYNFLYEDNELVCIFAPFGRITPMNTSNGNRWRYHYTITDHLGNTRVEFVAHDGTQPEVVQSSSYYPFGMTLRRNDYGSRNVNRRLYGGKELQDQTLAGITLDWYDFEARMYDPTIGRFLQTDPKAEKYFNVSPYTYCLNNPIRYFDYDGRDIWEINESGRIVNHIIDNTRDAFYMVSKDPDGNYQRTFSFDENGVKVYDFISFKFGTVESQRSISFSPDGKSTDTYDVYKVRGDDNGKKLFEFMSNNTKVEWSHAKMGLPGEKGLNFLTTSHERSREMGMTKLILGQLKFGYTAREFNHSHPRNTRFPSGISGFSSDKGDVPWSNWVSKKMKQDIRFNIYIPKDQSYIPYSKDSKKTDFDNQNE